MGGKRSFLFKDWLFSCFVLCFVSLTLGISGAAYAQDDEFTLEEIVVTAEKREAELQKIPMDISVVRPDDMERMNVHQMSELQKMIPDLQTNDGGGGTGMLQITIRGVDAKYWNPTAETTVAVSIDGVQLTRSNALEGKFYDLERVEMLKGPQGTLQGRGATAGSLTMISKKPDIGQFGGNIQVEFGSFNRRRIGGALNIPATDKLAFRLSGRSVKRDAQDDVGLSVQDMWGMRGSMRWEPTDRQSLVVTIDKDSTNNKGGYGFTGAYFKTFGDLEIVANDDPSLSEAFRAVASGGTVSTPYKAKWYYSETEDASVNRSDSQGISINYDHEFDFAWWSVQYGHRSSKTDLKWVLNSAPDLQPVGTTLNHSWFAVDTVDLATGEVTPAGTAPGDDGYGEANWYTASGFVAERDPITGDVIPVTQMILFPPTFPAALATDSQTDSQMSQVETRLTSQSSITSGDKTEWIAGAMYMDDQVVDVAYIFENAFNDIKLREYALFGQASYAPFARLNFTAGYRRVWDNKTYTGISLGDLGPVESSPDNGFLIRYASEIDPELYNNYSYYVNFGTYKFNISWQATENILPYIQYSKGMKTIDIDRSTGRATPPEQLNSVDIGVKTRLFDGRLQLNLSGYYYLYKNKNDWTTAYQCRIPQYDDDGNFTQCKNIASEGSGTDLDYIHNVNGVLSPGGAKQHGGSVNLTWVITPSDMFTVNASYQHNEYYDYNLSNAMRDAYEPLWGVGNVHSALIPENDVDRTGEEFGGRPWRGNFTYSHMTFIGTDMLNITLSGLYNGEGLDQYVARRTESEHTYPGNPDYITFDLAFNYSSTKFVKEGYRWSMRLFGNNILDSDTLASRTYNDGYNSSWSFAENSGFISGSFLTPRTFGAAFTLNF